MRANLLLHSQLLLCHLPVVHANGVTEGVNVLQTFLCVSQHIHRFPHLHREETLCSSITSTNYI